MTRAALLLALALAVGPRAAAGECTPASLRRALGEDRPPTVFHVAEIPGPVVDAFWRAYGDIDPDHRIADPGEKFQVGDVIVETLPRRRLIAAAASPRAAWLLYEKGGRAVGRLLFAACLADGRVTGAYSGLRAPDGIGAAELAPAFRDGCLVSPPREHGMPYDAQRCPQLRPEAPASSGP